MPRSSSGLGSRNFTPRGVGSNPTRGTMEDSARLAGKRSRKPCRPGMGEGSTPLSSSRFVPGRAGRADRSSRVAMARPSTLPDVALPQWQRDPPEERYSLGSTPRCDTRSGHTTRYKRTRDGIPCRSRSCRLTCRGSPMAEAPDSSPGQCGFESHLRHNWQGKHNRWCTTPRNSDPCEDLPP